jgi:hypothetical protein
VDRRTFSAVVGLCCVTLSGCLSDANTSGNRSVESHNGTDSAQSTGTPTRSVGSDSVNTAHEDQPPDSTPNESPTEKTTVRTSPPYNQELNDLRVTNERASVVGVTITLRLQDSETSKTLDITLEPGSRETFTDLDLLDQPVTIIVHIGSSTFEYVPQSDGMVFVRITADGVEFSEGVS